VLAIGIGDVEAVEAKDHRLDDRETLFRAVLEVALRLLTRGHA